MICGCISNLLQATARRWHLIWQCCVGFKVIPACRAIFLGLVRPPVLSLRWHQQRIGKRSVKKKKKVLSLDWHSAYCLMEKGCSLWKDFPFFSLASKRSSNGLILRASLLPSLCLCHTRPEQLFCNFLAAMHIFFLLLHIRAVDLVPGGKVISSSLSFSSSKAGEG